MLYIGRVVEVAYFREPTKNMDQLREAPSSMLIPAFVLVGAAVYFGLDTSLSVGLVQHVASSLINATY